MLLQILHMQDGCGMLIFCALDPLHTGRASPGLSSDPQPAPVTPPRPGQLLFRLRLQTSTSPGAKQTRRGWC